MFFAIFVNFTFYFCRSADAVYSDNAIGWVQVRDTNELCEVRAQITPEHRVTSSSYSIHCIIDEKEELIKEAKCDGCRAQNGKFFSN